MYSRLQPYANNFVFSLFKFSKSQPNVCQAQQLQYKEYSKSGVQCFIIQLRLIIVQHSFGMFRITRFLQSARSLITGNTNLSKPSFLVFTNCMSFCEAPRHKIFKMLDQQDIEENLDKIMIDISSLNTKLRQEAMQTIVDKIVSGLLPPRVILHQKFSIQLKKHIQLHYKAYFYRIAESMSRFTNYIDGQDKKIKKVIAKQIGDGFVICFELVKKMEPKEAAPKQIQLLRIFASYNFLYLSKLVEPAKQKQCINKSKDCYRLTLSKCGMLIKTLEEQEKQYQKAKPNETLEQQQERRYKLQELQYSKFEVIQEYAEVVLELLSVEDKLNEERKAKKGEAKAKEDKKAPQDVLQQAQIQFQFCKETIAMQPLLQKAIKYHSLVPSKTIECQYLYKLKKILVQLRNQKKLRELASSSKSKQGKQAQFHQTLNQFNKNMNELFSEGAQELKKLQAQELQPQQLAEHVMLLVSTQLQRFQVEDQEREGLDAKQLGEQVQMLVNYIASQEKRKRTLTLIIKKVKETFQLKIDSFVEKVPRNLRTQRKKREIQE